MTNCVRCGIQAKSETCEGCCRDMRIACERMSGKPICGTCGDTGYLPEEAYLTYGIHAYEPFKVECPDCERCSCCGVELRSHLGNAEECP